MAGGIRVYHHAGPAEALAAPQPPSPGHAVLTREDITGAGEPFTFVIDQDGILRLAPRRIRFQADLLRYRRV